MRAITLTRDDHKRRQQRQVNEEAREYLATFERRARLLASKRLRTPLGSNGRDRIDAELIVLVALIEGVKALDSDQPTKLGSSSSS